MKHHLSIFIDDDRGQTMIEAAMVLPLIMFLFISLMYFHMVGLNVARSAMAARHGAWLFSKLKHTTSGEEASAKTKAEAAVKAFWPEGKLPLSTVAVNKSTMKTLPILDFFLNNKIFRNLPGVGGHGSCRLVLTMKDFPFATLLPRLFGVETNGKDQAFYSMSGEIIRETPAVDPFGIYANMPKYTARAYFPDRDEWHNSWGLIKSMFDSMISTMNSAVSEMASSTEDMWDEFDSATGDLDDAWQDLVDEQLAEWRQKFPWAF